MWLQTIEILDDLIVEGTDIMDVRNKEEVILRMKSAVASKQFGQEDILCPLIADVIITSLFSNIIKNPIIYFSVSNF